MKTIQIPQHDTKIGKLSFYYCKQLQTVLFPLNSELSTIDSNAFYFTSIRELTIPLNVKIIKNNAFEGCKHLQKVNIASNSEISSIEN